MISVSANTMHMLLITAGLVLLDAIAPRSANWTPRRSATTSRNLPVPAAQRSFIAKSCTDPFQPA